MQRSCGVCQAEEAKYKCPTCARPYCCRDCWKTHRSVPCQKPEAPLEEEEKEDKTERKYDFPTEDTVPLDKLEQLRHSEELKECLKNRHVRDIMQAILTDPNPTKAIALAMTEPIFVEMADACLRVVEPSDDRRPS